MMSPVLLVLGPLHEMIERLGEDPAANTRTGLLRGSVVHFFEHTWHAKQIRRFETAQIGEQMLGSRQIADHALSANRHVLDIAGEAVRQRQEQHQPVGLVQHLVKNDVAIEHDMREVAMGQHRTLRTSRGARCVNDGEHVVRLDPGNDLIKGIVIDALSEIGDRVKTVRFEIEHVTQPFMHVTNLFERLRVDGISSEGNNRLHLFHDGSGLLGRIGFINRNAYRADGRACEIDHTPLVTGGRVNDHHASGFDSKTDKALRHGAHTSEHLACRHIMPLPSLIILPLCDKIIRILLRTTRQQRIYRVIIRGAVGRLWYKFSQHGSL